MSDVIDLHKEASDRLTSFSKHFKKRLKEKNLTVEDIVDKLNKKLPTKIRKEKVIDGIVIRKEKVIDGIGIETVKKWYYGTALPEYTNLSLLCNILDCDMDYLLRDMEEPTHDIKFICKETGLSVPAIEMLQNGTMAKKGGLFDWEYNQIGSIINFLLTNKHGMNILQSISDYINCNNINFLYKGKPITEDIHIKNSETNIEQTLSPNEIEALLLLQIQRELMLLKDDNNKEN